MRLVTYSRIGQMPRSGARVNDSILDLNSAYAALLRERGEAAAQRLADARVPAEMRQLFEGGDRSLDAAREALDFALKQGRDATGLAGERLTHSAVEVKIHAPILPRKFFHTAGNFREHHEEAQKAGFSHPVLPWIVFFQNVDAIIGPDEPVIYPQHLTEELDYELELAVVLKRPGKHFGPEEARDYVGGYVIFNDVTARDVQRREMKSGVF